MAGPGERLWQRGDRAAGPAYTVDMAKMAPDDPEYVQSPAESLVGGAVSELVVILCTFPNPEDLGEIALTLVGENLCACVNILRESLSIYRWNGEIVTNKEVLCLIKTSRARHAALVARLSELHPYDLPEIITQAVGAVNEPYLRWVHEVTAPPR